MSGSREGERLAAKHAPWARRMARRLAIVSGMLHLVDDLEAVALMATAEAERTYDPARKTKFVSYAWLRVTGEIAEAIGREAEHLAFVHGAVLDAMELVEDEEGATAEQDDAMIDRIDAAAFEALSAYVMGAASVEWSRSGEAGMLSREAFATLKRAVARLDEEDRRLVDLRYWRALGWTEVAEALGLSERGAKERDRKIRGRLAADLLKGT